MRLQWKGRSYRPAANLVKVTKPSVNELIKPLSMKAGLGSAVLTGEFISGIGDAYGPDVPVVTPTASVTPTITQTSTPTQTSSPTPSFTPTLTPTSTPFPIVQPSLWFDASDDSTLFKVLSGGTTYVSQITSKGTETWTLTAATSDRWCIYSASTFLPGSPGIMRFTPNATTTLRQGYSAYGRTPIQHTGATVFVVFAGVSTSFQTSVYSGNTAGAVVLSGAFPFDRLNHVVVTNATTQITYPQNSNSTSQVPPPISGAALGDKYLLKQICPNPTGFGTWELNQSGGTSATNFTGTTVTPQWNAAFIGGITTSAGTQTYNNSNIEFCEMMVYNRILTIAEQEAVELYLRDKWRYDEWASPVPTPTQTPSQTQTSTPTVTPTVTITPSNTTTITPTPSSTPPPFVPSGITNLQLWFMSPSGSSVSSWTNYGLLGGAATQADAFKQPARITNDTFGTGFTGTSMAFAAQDFMRANISSTSFTDKTFFAVFKVVGRSIQDTFLSLRSSTTDTNATRVFNYDMYASPTTHNTQSIPGVSTFTATTGSFIFASSGTSSSFQGELNGVLGASATTAFAQTSASVFEFGYDPGGANSNDVRIFEFIAYNRQLTPSEYSRALNYLKTKYNFYP